jgi:hypothetical protein
LQNYFFKKTTAVSHGGCMAAACRRMWATPVGLTVVGHGGWWSKLLNFETIPRRLVVKTDNFETVV